jgi:hypothetical protein
MLVQKDAQHGAIFAVDVACTVSKVDVMIQYQEVFNVIFRCHILGQDGHAV